jgi:hypothetical protein
MAKELGADLTGYILSRVGNASHAEISQMYRLAVDLELYGQARLAGACHQEVLDVVFSCDLGEYALLRKAGADHQAALALLGATGDFEFGPDMER